MKKLGLLFCLCSSLVFAREIDLEEAIERSLEHKRGVQIAEKQVEISKKNMNQAIKKALPTVVYTGAYKYSEYDRAILRHKTGSAEVGRSGYQQSIRVTQPIFRGGTVIAGIQGAKAYSEIANLSFVKEKLQTRLQTIQIYSSIVNAKRTLEALESSRAQLIKRKEKQELQLDLRLITKTDLLKTEYTLLGLDSQMEKLRSVLEIQTENLKIQTGLQGEAKLEVKDFRVPKSLTQSIRFEEDKKQALESSVTALLAKYQSDMAKAQQTASFGAMLPQVNLFASYGTGERTRLQTSREEAEWVGGLEVSWNVFSFGSDYDRYQVASLEKEIKELSEEETQDKIRLQLKEAYSELQRLELLRSSKEKALETAELNFSMDQERYDAGLISTLDYLDSEIQLRNAKVDYYKAEMDYFYAFELYRSLLV